MKRVIEQINKILKTRKSIGYVGIYYNDEKIGYFATKEFLKDENIETTDGMLLLEKNYISNIKKTIKQILAAKIVTLDGDYYGDGFSGWLIEGIKFWEE